MWLNSGGKLKYPAEFSSKKREVHLEGQGYFSVKRDEDAPFMVRIDDFILLKSWVQNLILPPMRMII